MKRGGPTLRTRLDLVPLSPGLALVAAQRAARRSQRPRLRAVLRLFAVPIATLACLAWLWQRSRSAGAGARPRLWLRAGLFPHRHELGLREHARLRRHGLAAGGLRHAVLLHLLSRLFPALPAGLFARLRRRDWVRLVVVFPAAWALTEWMRGWMFTGFPWLAVGYSQSPDGPLVRIRAGARRLRRVAAGCG